MQCHEFSQIIDSYLKDELLIETNHDVIRHLEECAACRRELAARRATRAQLRRAFNSAPDLQVRPEFAFQLRNKLKQQALGNSYASLSPLSFLLRPQWLAAAACLVVALLAGIVIWRARVANTPNQLAHSESVQPNTSPDKAIGDERELRGAAVHLAGFEVTEQAVGDHQNCAIKYNLAEEPISLKEAGRKYDVADTDLARAVKSGATLRTGEINYLEDHSCVYHGRRFAHVILEYKGRTISLLVAEATDPARGGAAGDDVIACSSINGYQVSCFGTKRHTVFVVSDLPESDNLKIARSLAPTVAAHLRQTEA